MAFAGEEGHFVMSSESASDVPNYYLATLGAPIEAAEGEATRAMTRLPSAGTACCVTESRSSPVDVQAASRTV